ncbi:MAG: septum formation initiator family protein [Gammaproteobacteria bacterium]|nr:septum formation initiator family protein [Gammaproteobacteria bacterium]
MLNLSSKSLTMLLSLLLLFLQYEIWSTRGGLNHAWRLTQSIKMAQEQNKELQEKNMILAADVDDLRKGDESVEEHARMDLGMIKKNEIFYQVVD